MFPVSDQIAHNNGVSSQAGDSSEKRDNSDSIIKNSELCRSQVACHGQGDKDADSHAKDAITKQPGNVGRNPEQRARANRRRGRGIAMITG